MSKTVFISYARETDSELIKTVTQAAERAGCIVVTCDFENLSGVDTAAAAQSAIHRTDGLIALLDGYRANVFFELGFAMGAGKNVILVADAKVDIPSDMAAIPFVRLVGNEAKDSSTICRALKAITGVDYSWRNLPWESMSNEPAELATCLREPSRFDALEPRRFEELVAELFSKTGYDIAYREPKENYCWDFIARSTLGGHPRRYLVEVKKMSRQSRVSVEHVYRLLECTLATHATAGLLISSSGFTSSALALAKGSHARLACLTLADLLERIAKNQLPDEDTNQASDASAGESTGTAN